MTAFDEIRPYTDEEVPAVLGRLLAEPSIASATAQFAFPRASRWWPALAARLARRQLHRKLSGVATVSGVQDFIAGLFARMIEHTTDGFSTSGADHLTPGESYLFVSNHRDIALDSGFMNWALIHAGHETSRIAVGDNLFGVDYAADLIRLNKSFIVKRGAKGAKAAYAAMSLTSKYIRHSLEEGVSVWIAQREGRAKDGVDRTDAALIKMFALAYRKETQDLGEVVERCALVPVSLSYEMDPCDQLKARELFLTEHDGSYVKPDDEDLKSIVTGIVGYKGRVHVAFGTPLRGPFEDAEAVARAIDAQLIPNLKIFPTHREATRLLGDASGPFEDESDSPGGPNGTALAAFRTRVAATPEAHRPYLLQQYAGVLSNQRAGVDATPATADQDRSAAP
jgi:1-acyl-sn-glycerol-3-phosphate acyltransferase